MTTTHPTLTPMTRGAARRMQNKLSARAAELTRHGHTDGARLLDDHRVRLMSATQTDDEGGVMRLIQAGQEWLDAWQVQSDGSIA